MGFYDEMQAVATDLLTQFDQGPLFLVKVERQEPDPATPWIVGVVNRNKYSLAGVVRRVSRKFINNTTIVATDAQATVPVKMRLIQVNGTPFPGTPDVYDVQPFVSDEFYVGATQRTILDVRRIPEAGTPVAWTIILKG